MRLYDISLYSSRNKFVLLITPIYLLVLCMMILAFANKREDVPLDTPSLQILLYY